MDICKTWSRSYFVAIVVVMLISLGIDRYLAVWEWTYHREWFSGNRILLWSVYLSVSIGTVHFFMARNPFARITAFLYSVISIAYVLFYLVSEDRSPEIGDVLIAFDGFKDFSALGLTAIRAYWYWALIAIGASLLITTELAILGSRARKEPGRKLPLWLAMAVYFSAIAFCCTQRFTGSYSPLYAKSAALVVRSINQSSALYSGRRDAPVLAAIPARKAKSHILFIMDESIAGYSLGINGCKFDTTRYLETLTPPKFFNYGLASSAGNYSVLSNLIVFSGLRVDQLPDKEQRSLKNTSIMGYAKAAGRKTLYIDAQNVKPMNQLMLRDLMDFTYIPVNNKLGDIQEYELDRLALKKVAAEIKSATEPLFIYLLKMGAHVSFSSKHPNWMNGDGITSESAQATSYLKAVRWGVDDFFKELDSELSGTDVIVVYTGDHGINIDLDGASPGTRKYLYGKRNDPDVREATVPLCILLQSAQAESDFAQAGGFVRANINAATHYQLFPTLLRLLGYDAQAVSSQYGPSLFDLPPRERYFVSKFFVGDEVVEEGMEGNEVWLNPFSISRLKTEESREDVSTQH